MTRTRVESPAISSWDGADQAVREIGEAEIELQLIAGQADLKINEAKDEAAKESAPLMAEKDRLLVALHQFTAAHKDDLKGKGRKKSKLLLYGQVGFRASERVVKLQPDDEIEYPMVRSRREGLRTLLTEIALAVADAQAAPEDADDHLLCLGELAKAGLEFLDRPLPPAPEMKVGEVFVRWVPGPVIDLRALAQGEFVLPSQGMVAVCRKAEEAR